MHCGKWPLRILQVNTIRTVGGGVGGGGCPFMDHDQSQQQDQPGSATRCVFFQNYSALSKHGGSLRDQDSPIIAWVVRLSRWSTWLWWDLWDYEKPDEDSWTSKADVFMVVYKKKESLCGGVLFSFPQIRPCLSGGFFPSTQAKIFTDHPSAAFIWCHTSLAEFHGKSCPFCFPIWV